MPVTCVAGGRATRHLAICLIVITAVLLIEGVLDIVLAQGGPFGAPRPQRPPPPASGVVGWILAKQGEFYQKFSGLIRAAKADGSAVWSLLGVSFLYGIFHAAGPGHGKAVISSYVVANDETWRRGVVLSFASALLQALVAVVFVAIAAVLLNVTAPAMKSAVDVIEIVSYALIVLIGLRLVWVKGRGLLAMARALRHPASPPVHHDHDHAVHGQHKHEQHHHDHAAVHAHHDHGHHVHARDDHGHHDHNHGDEASAWGHAHALEPKALAGPGGWQRGLSAIVAVGLRPCSGAIIVLVFALAQGLFWTGVAATLVMGLGTAITVAAIATVAVGARSWASRVAKARAGYSMLAMRGLEVAAAVVITAFGVLLLSGYMVSERMVGL
jgi:nickel/cobalt exporter